MATKYDVFELLYSHGAMKPAEVVKTLGGSYHAIYQILLKLEKAGMMRKNEKGFQAVRSLKHDQLYNLIKYCLQNDVHYNALFDKNITRFIARTLEKKQFSSHDFDLAPQTFKKYVDILSRSGLLIPFSKKPFKAAVMYNTFLHDLLIYFGHRIGRIAEPQSNHLKNIERELTIFRNLRKKNASRYKTILRNFEIRFIQHSLSLEGNPITLRQTFKLLKDQIVPNGLALETVEEVKNYQKAVDEMLKDSANEKILTKQTILNYHYLAMQHRPFAGKIRDEEVYIRGNPNFKVAKVSEIEPKLNIFLKKYNLFIKKKHTLKEVLEFSAYFHNEFQHIHPFVDGNSRTTRLITFGLLRHQDIPVIDIPLGLLESYLNATKGSKKRNDQQLTKIIQLIIIYNLKKINEQLRS